MSSIDPNRNMVCAAVDLPRLGTIYSEVKGPPERVVERGPHQTIAQRCDLPVSFLVDLLLP